MKKEKMKSYTQQKDTKVYKQTLNLVRKNQTFAWLAKGVLYMKLSRFIGAFHSACSGGAGAYKRKSVQKKVKWNLLFFRFVDEWTSEIMW